MQPHYHSHFRNLVVDQRIPGRRNTLSRALLVVVACLLALLLLQSVTFSTSPSLRTQYPPSLVPDINTKPQVISPPAASLRTSASVDTSISRLTTSPPLVAASSHRVAVLVPNMKNSLPPWFLAFAFSAHLSAPLLEWLIFMDNPTYLELPPNIRIIHMTEHEYYTRIALLDNSLSRSSSSLSSAATAVGKLIQAYPYFLVEVKPALGTIFEEFSHWAFADIDVMIGRVPSFVTPDILNTYDIYTASFGDNNRLYMRGQMTIMRSSHAITTMWRHCSHLTHLLSRVSKYLRTPDASWQLQSAEGCFSRVVADHNVSILFSNTQLSDAFHAATKDKESLLLGSSLIRCHKAPLNTSLSTSYLTSPPQRATHPVEEERLSPVDRVGPGCAHWIHPKYQVCVPDNNVTKTTELVLRTGKVFKYTDPYEPPSAAGGQCREAIVSHFQGWKKVFFKYMTRAPSLNANALLLSQSGFSPLIVAGLPTYGSLMNLTYAMGVVHPPHNQLPRNTSFPITTNYCLEFASDMKKCSCYVDFDDIRIFPSSQHYDNVHVTLVRGGIYSSEMSSASLLNVWDGPQILVLGYVGHRPQISASNTSVTIVMVNVSRCSNGMADNTLINVGLDLTITDRVMIAPLHANYSRNAEITLRQHLLEAENMSVLTALVVPMYEAINILPSDALLSNSSDVPAIYPSKSVAPQHSESLILSYVESSALMLENTAIGVFDDSALQEILYKRKITSSRVVLPRKTFGSTAFTGEKSLMYPVAFNMRKNGHGDTFIRLPEELDGSMCYGNVLLSILETAGYALHWAPVRASPRAIDGSYDACVHGSHTSRATFVTVLIDYLKRTRKLRESGIEQVYTTKALEDLF